MKKTLIAIILVLAFVTACSKTGGGTKAPGDSQQQGNAGQALVKVIDYFPFTKDVHVVYRGTGNEYAGYDTYVEYIKDNIMQTRTDNGGTVVVNVYEVSEGEVKKVYSRPETYYRYDFTSQRGDEEVLIKEPIKIGTEWTLKDGAKRSITAVDTDVSTPLGSYKAVEVTTARADSTFKDYYAKGVGLVKSVFTAKDSSFNVISEIEKLEKDVPFKQNVMFYFPDFLNDRVAYMERAIEINTGQDMKYKFQKEFKTIPEGSKLSKVLTPNVQVLGATVDDSAGIVTVDFSRHLIDDMNAGAGFESMLLKSMVNTLGQYYQVDRVIITVEGKPYSSGHILLKPGEYFKVNTDKCVLYKK